MEHVDVVVLGGGSGGETVASLVSPTHSVAVVEAVRVGGECPFVACMPSKAMLRAAEVRRIIARATDYGAVSIPLQLDSPSEAYSAAVARREKIVERRDDSSHVRILQDAGARVLRGWGRVTQPGIVTVESPAGERTELSWTDLVIATGSTPIIPAIPGLDNPALQVWTSDQALTSPDLPASMAVLGGGPVGCELAQLFAAFGVAVTLIDTAERLIAREEPSISDALATVLKNDGIDLRLGRTVQQVRAMDHQTCLSLDDGSSITVERLLIASGRTPRFSNLGLEILGISPGKDGLEIDSQCRVHSQRHVWAVGDVTGIAPFTHTANYQARIVAANMQGQETHANYRAIPRAVYTFPEIAAVGLTEEEARQKGYDVAVVTLNLQQTARATVHGTVETGQLVLLADRTRRVLLGASAIGPHASEWISEAILAVRAAIPLDILIDVVHPFPTFSEACEPLLRQLV